MQPPTATHTTYPDKTDKVTRFLVKALCTPRDARLLSPDECKRLAEALCTPAAQLDYSNHLPALVRALKKEEHLLQLAKAQDDVRVRELARIPVRELASSKIKKQRTLHKQAACQSSMYTEDFRTDVIERFDEFDTLRSTLVKGRVIPNDKQPQKEI